MKAILKLALFLLVILLTSSIVLPQRYFHPILDRDPSIDKRFEAEIQDRQADLVFMGNSILKKAIDVPQMEALLETTIVDASLNGSIPQDWYLILENNIATSTHRPLTVVVFFIDRRLTGVNTSVRRPEDDRRLNKFAGLEEPVYDSLVNDLGFLERFSLRTISPYAYQEPLRSGLEAPFKYAFSDLFSKLNREEINAAVESTFSNDNMDPALLEIARQKSEVFGDTDSADSFAQLVERSFLPAMIQLADESDLRLVFVRIPTRANLFSEIEDTGLDSYIQDLAAYLAANNITFIEFSTITELSYENFRDNDHLNESGQPIFTEIAAEAFSELGLP